MTKLTDPDLFEQLEAARGTPRYAILEKTLPIQQSRRNQQREKEAAKAAQLDLLTPIERRRSWVREVIENDGPAPHNLQYMHSSLAICGLPYRQLPIEQRVHVREQGKMRVRVHSGELTGPNGVLIPQPIPWGAKPRLILAYLSTEAIRQQSPTIDVARSFTGFMRQLGFTGRGGERGNIKPFKEQLQALAACRMEIASWDEKRSRVIDTKPFDTVDLWLSDDGDRSIWPETLTFSPSFYASLKERAMPVDSRALHAFANSARKLDILFWLNYRLHSSRSAVTVPWKALQSQFGGDEWSRDRKFKQSFVADLLHIKSVFPQLPYSIHENGFTLGNADPSVLAIPEAPRKAIARSAKPR
jgi:hypothetical protein